MDNFFYFINKNNKNNTENNQFQENAKELTKDEYRNKIKENLSANLKTQYFFNDEEIMSVMQILDKYYIKIDEMNSSVDYTNYGLISSQQMEIELLKIQKMMLKEVEQKIKETMTKKVAEAKEYFKKNK